MLESFLGGERFFMLKIVVFDGGYGGEFFADYLDEQLPTVEIIRVIDWRNADKLLSNSKCARSVAEKALRPYIEKVDLIIFANHLLSLTSLNFFKRKYKNQKFIGMELKRPDTFIKNNVLILTTKPVSKTISYRNFIFQIKKKIKTVNLDSWPTRIDDGELTEDEIKITLVKFLEKEKFRPDELILACSQFNDIKKELTGIFGKKVPIYDSYDDTVIEACRVLKIRGRLGKRKK